MRTDDSEYTERLSRLSGARWKQILDVQRPYRWNLRRYDLGRTLDVGCGIGRLLGTLAPGSVGVDHNAESVAVARASGLEAYTVEEFRAREWEPFDGMLMSGLIEHLSPEDGLNLVREYVPHLRSGGRLLFICPQERGYKYDPTHIRWTTPKDLNDLAREVGLVPVSSRSFPFPRPVGRVFTFNEFNVLVAKP